MYFFSYLPLLSNGTQRLQSAHVLLICLSLLTLGVIVYVYNYKLVKNNFQKTRKTFATKLKLTRPELSNDKKFSNLIRENPALPLEFLRNNGNRSLKISAGCAELPDFFSLDFYNNYWQTYKAGKLLMRLYGAYFDNRLINYETPVVRLLVLMNTMKPSKAQSYCQLWFEDSTKPTIVKTSEYKAIWQHAWTQTQSQSPKLLYPFMMTCELPEHKRFSVPKAVSLVAEPCEKAANLLKVYYGAVEHGTAAKKPFSICVKGLSQPFSDLSLDLIEWLETFYQLQIGKVHFNVYNVHPNVERVLNFYSNLGYVDSKPVTVGNAAVVLPLLQHIFLKNEPVNFKLHEAIFAHDCFYRNMYHYDFIAYMDINIVPMPLVTNLNTWIKILDDAKTKAKCSNLTRLCLQYVNNERKGERERAQLQKPVILTKKVQKPIITTKKVVGKPNVEAANKTEVKNKKIEKKKRILSPKYNVSQKLKTEKPVVPANITKNNEKPSNASIVKVTASLSNHSQHINLNATNNTKNSTPKNRTARDVSNFLLDQLSDKRFFFTNQSLRACWHNTNFAVLMDDQLKTKLNECSFELNPNVAQLLHFRLSNELETKDRTHAKLEFFKSALNRRVQQVAKLLNVN